MRKYSVNTDTLANFLIPAIMGGRKNVLWVQSLLYPLQKLNDSMQEFFTTRNIDSCVTSQVGWFEWYLTEKMKKYFSDPTDSIRITHYTDNGVPFFFSNELGLVPYVVYQQNEAPTSTNPEELPKPLEFKDERSETITSSFFVNVPKISVTQEVFNSEVIFHINKYRLGGKTFKIIYQ